MSWPSGRASGLLMIGLMLESRGEEVNVQSSETWRLRQRPHGWQPSQRSLRRLQLSQAFAHRRRSLLLTFRVGMAVFIVRILTFAMGNSVTTVGCWRRGKGESSVAFMGRPRAEGIGSRSLWGTWGSLALTYWHGSKPITVSLSTSPL